MPAPQREAMKKELDATTSALADLIERGQRNSLDRRWARRDNAILAGCVEHIASLLEVEPQAEFPRGGLAEEIASGCPDLEAGYEHGRPSPALVQRLGVALKSRPVRQKLFGAAESDTDDRDSDKRHRGSIAAAEDLVADVTGLSRGTVRAARRDLGTLRRRAKVKRP